MNAHEGSGSAIDPYRGVLLVLFAASAVGAIAAVAVGMQIENPVMLAAAISMGVAAGILAGIVNARSERTVEREDAGKAGATVDTAVEDVSSTLALPPADRRGLVATSERLMAKARQWLRSQQIDVGRTIGFMGGSAILVLLLHRMSIGYPGQRAAVIATVLSLCAAGLSAMAARYLARIAPADFPEAEGLTRGARVLAWILTLTAVSVALEWVEARALFNIVYFAILVVDAAVCFNFLKPKSAREAAAGIFPHDIGVFSILGRRANILASVLDAAEHQLGIDLRSTWALTILRRSLEPLAFGLCLAGWLSTSLAVVGTQEQGLVERLGVPRTGPPLQPGLHLKLPWPFDRVFRIPVQQVQTIQVGHEGEETEGPENVLWAVEHAPNEYTLLLGNGRDLITVDAAVQYRIVDPRAWRYNSQNPAVALKAIAYRAVMRSTVDLTLSEALSQNIAVLTSRIRAMVQKDADNLHLGVEILGFTVGGMHPPVPVASAYEAVVSAELRKVTAAVNAQVFRNLTVPAAEASALADENAARAEGAQALALASGQAWSFRALESEYHAAPNEFFFRRRLETLEKTLPGRRYTVVDSRFLRDGGEIWVTR